jgi:hypothetical protein
MQWRELGEWRKQGYSSWGEYCKDHSSHLYSASSYRAMKAELPIAELIESAGFTALSQHEARQIRERLQALPDESLRIEAYAQTRKVTGKVVPSEAELEATYSVLERAKVERVVTVMGEDVDIRDHATLAAITEELYEIRARQAAHMQAKPQAKLTVQVTGAILNALSEALPKGAILPDLGQNLTLLWAKGE